VDAFLLDLQYAVRRCLKSPGFTLVVVFTLALGLGATTAVFGVVDAVLLRPLPYQGADRLVFVAERTRGGTETQSSTSFLNAQDFAAGRSLEALGLARGWSPTLTGLGDAERLDAALVTHGVFDAFRIVPQRGRPLLPSDAEGAAANVAVVSDAFWRARLGGDAGVVGRRILLNAQPFTIVGVLPSDFHGPEELAAGLWANYTHDPRDTRSARNLRGYGRLAPGASVAAARAELGTISARLARLDPDANGGMEAVVRPLRAHLAGDTKQPLLLVLGAAVFLLAIACANLSNLLLARGASRASEMTLRAALGASRSRAVRQLLTEALVLSALGAVAGLLAARVSSGLLVALGPESLRERAPTIDGRVLAFAALLTIGTTLVVGLLPALRLTRLDLQTGLRDASSSVIRGGSRLRDLLAAAQIALALSLAVVAGLLLRSFERLTRLDPGVRVENLLTAGVNLPGARYPDAAQAPFYERLVARVMALPGVGSAAVASIAPFSADWDRVTLDVAGNEGARETQKPEADRYFVGAGFFETAGIPLREGRFFGREDRDGAPDVAIVDEVFARRLAPGRSALGVRFRVPGRRDAVAAVVGVVGHVRQYGLEAASQGQVYFPHTQNPWRWMTLLVRTASDPLSLAGAVRAAVKELDPELAVFSVATAEQLLSERSSLRRFTLLLVGTFSAIAIALAVVGLYGVLSYLVAQRRREIAIRIALGARPVDVLALFMRHGAALALCGVAAGLLSTLALSKLVRSLLFHVSAADPATVLGASTLLAATALLACVVPALQATRVDPITALRAE
jgi:putative ABC transport system permease protein